MAKDLTQLRDIHLPSPIDWWPMAPGWYLLIASIAVISFTLGLFLRRHYKNSCAKREALKILSTYQKRYLQGNCSPVVPSVTRDGDPSSQAPRDEGRAVTLQDKNNQAYSAAISNLLRRVALAYYPRTEVAGLQGEAWIAFLNSTIKGVNFTPIRALLLELPYRPAQAQNLRPLFDTAHKWIKRQGKPCLN